MEERSLKNPRFLLRVIVAAVLVITVAVFSIISMSDKTIKSDIVLGAVSFADEWCYGECVQESASYYQLVFGEVEELYCTCLNDAESVTSKIPAQWDYFMDESLRIRGYTELNSIQQKEVADELQGLIDREMTLRPISTTCTSACLLKE